MLKANIALDYAELIRNLSDIAHWDISVSIRQPGSVFQRPNVSSPSPLANDQMDMAEIYGVKFALPLTNGTTQGNVLAISAVASPDQKMLLQRNSHVSAYAPMYNVGLDPHYLYPAYLPEWDVLAGVTPEQVNEALHANPDIRMIFVTSPNYFGIVGDIKGIVEVAHQHDAIVIVDAAHGAYYNFYQQSPMPIAAEHAGADIVTQSTHKTLGALSQGSLLLINNTELIDPLYHVVNRLGDVSTSFSYPILLSIGLAVSQMHMHGQSLLENAIQVAESARDQIRDIDGLRCFGQEIIDPAKGVVALDPLRITVNVEGWNVTGYEVEDQLVREEHIVPELATWNNVLFLLTPFDGQEEADALVNALRRLENTMKRSHRRQSLPPPPQTQKRMTPREAFYAVKRREVPVSEAVGKVSGETIAAYPPGIAIVVEGEEITREIVEYLRLVQGAGGYLKGASHPEFDYMCIVEA